MIETAWMGFHTSSSSGHISGH